MLVAKKKNALKIKWKNLLLMIFLVGALLLGLIFGTKLLSDYQNTKKMIEKIHSEIEVKNVVDDEKTRVIAPDSTLSKFDAYWSYVKQGLIEVDMANLKRINTDAVGYIEVKGTNFSYPLVKGEDSFYRKHSFDKSENSLGWIYMSEENNLNELDTNTVIYGNKNIFGLLQSDLKEVLKDEWKDENDNYLIKFYTNKYSTLWQIISVYNTKDDEHLKTTFTDDEEFEKYIDDMLKKTEIKFKGYAKKDDKLLTLTTNSKGSNLVIQAKLIKIRTEE